MNIVESTAAYEAWVKSQVPIVAADLTRKHDAMRRAPFPFLRGTFYRWSQLWAEACFYPCRAWSTGSQRIGSG